MKHLISILFICFSIVGFSQNKEWLDIGDEGKIQFSGMLHTVEVNQTGFSGYFYIDLDKYREIPNCEDPKTVTASIEIKIDSSDTYLYDGYDFDLEYPYHSFSSSDIKALDKFLYRIVDEPSKRVEIYRQDFIETNITSEAYGKEISEDIMRVDGYLNTTITEKYSNYCKVEWAKDKNTLTRILQDEPNGSYTKPIYRVQNKLLISSLIPSLIQSQLDTFPSTWIIDSVQYNRRGGEWYEDVFFNVGTLTGTIPLDSTTVTQRINIAVNDSIEQDRALTINSRRIDRFRTRIDQAREEERPILLNDFRETKIYLRQLRRLLKRVTN